MTAKRFTLEWYAKKYQELTEENEQLKSALKELKEIGDYQYCRIKELYEENEQLKHLIQQAYNNEKTELGKSVLKQLQEAIQ